MAQFFCRIILGAIRGGRFQREQSGLDLTGFLAQSAQLGILLLIHGRGARFQGRQLRLKAFEFVVLLTSQGRHVGG